MLYKMFRQLTTMTTKIIIYIVHSSILSKNDDAEIFTLNKLCVDSLISISGWGI